MTWTVVAAAIIGLLSPVVRSLIWGVPFGFLSVATVIRSFVGSALTVLVIGTVTFFVLRATPVPPEQVGLGAGLLGGSLGLVLLWGSARRMRDVRGLSILCQRLQERDVATTALGALNRLLDRVRRENPQRYVALVLMCTGFLTQAGLWEEARSRLRDLDDPMLTRPQSVLRNQALATCELHFDEIDEAALAIGRASQNALWRILGPKRPTTTPRCRPRTVWSGHTFWLAATTRRPPSQSWKYFSRRRDGQV